MSLLLLPQLLTSNTLSAYYYYRSTGLEPPLAGFSLISPVAVTISLLLEFPPWCLLPRHQSVKVSATNHVHENRDRPIYGQLLVHPLWEERNSVTTVHALDWSSLSVAMGHPIKSMVPR